MKGAPWQDDRLRIRADSQSAGQTIKQQHHSVALALFARDPGSTMVVRADPMVMLLPHEVEGMRTAATRSVRAGLSSTLNVAAPVSVADAEVPGESASKSGGYETKLTSGSVGALVKDSGKYLSILQHHAEGNWRDWRPCCNNVQPHQP